LAVGWSGLPDGGTIVPGDLSAATPPNPNRPAIRLRGLRHAYGEREVLRGLDLDLAAGQSLVVVGPNGAGKTTLLRILATLLRPGEGEIAVLGCSLPKQAWQLRGRIGYVSHEPLLYRDLTGRENLEFHARLHGMTGAQAKGRIAEVLEAIGMAGRADDRVNELSAGLRQRLSICRAVLAHPELLLLDEPDSNLDAASRELVGNLIGADGAGGGYPGRTRVIVTHDPDRYRAEADQFLELG
jgi:heme exporter protein A